MNKKLSMETCRTEVPKLLFLAVITLLAVGVRISVRSFVADDWSIYWSHWLSELETGGFRALADDFYDYAPPVMYILYLITLLPVNAMTAFKGLCCLLEFAGAAVIAGIVRECTGSREKAQFAYGIFLFLPTVILNASVWSQCDIIYTLLILYSVYFLMKDKTWTGMWFYGAAFAVKLQTLFIFPFLIILWVRKRVDLKHFLTIPVMYFLGILPAWLAGRPFMELLGIYAFQGSKDRWSLSIKFPNIYQIIGNNYFLDEYVGAGMYLILGILMLVMFYMAYQKVQVTKEYIVLMVLFYGMLTTYFIPHMHERYLYLTDAFLIIYVMIRVKRFPLLIGASFLTVVGYAQYLTKNEPNVSYGILAFVQLGILIRIGLDLYGYMHDPARQEYPAKMQPGKASKADELLRGLLFQEFRAGSLRFDFLEALLAVCITGTGYLLRTPFETGLPHWPYLLAEWYLAFAGAALVWRYTKNRKKAVGTYAVLLILPTVVADGTILRSDACVGALLVVTALLLWEYKDQWLFTAVMAAVLLLHVKYIGILFVCIVLWQNKKLKAAQLFLLAAAGGARFVYAYRAWLHAGYTLVTFQWANIYEIVGTKAVQGQLIDPIALVGLFLALGLMTMIVRLFSQGRLSGSGPMVSGQALFRLFLFFGLAVGYFLPYMDQSYGYLYCILSVLYVMLAPGEFLVPMLLQIVTYAGYQECLNGESMMPMAVFSLIQFFVLSYLGIQLLQEMGVLNLCRQKN